MSDDDPEEGVDEEALEWLTELGLAEYATAFAENYGLKSKEDFEDYGVQCDLDEMNMPRALQRTYLRELGEYDSDDEAFDDEDDDDDDSVDSMDSETSQRYGEYLASVEEDLDAALSAEQLERANQRFRDGLVATGVDTATGSKLKDAVHLARLREQFENQETLSEELAVDIIKTATELLRAEPNVVELTTATTTVADGNATASSAAGGGQGGVTINVVGDIHGQFYDLIKLMDICGPVSPRQQFLFLGDYVDRGAFSCEVLLYVYALKICYPQYVHLLRGNHEYTPDIRRFHGRYGFKTECTGKYGRGIYNQFLRSFLALPLAGLVTTAHGDRILCVHAGLSEKLERLEQLNDLPRDKDYVDWHVRHRWEDQHAAAQHEILEDLMWSDPMEDDNALDDDQWVENKQRQCSVYYGATVTRAFLERNSLRTIVRAHQVQAKGGRAHFDEDGLAGAGGGASVNTMDKSIRWLLREKEQTPPPPPDPWPAVEEQQQHHHHHHLSELRLDMPGKAGGMTKKKKKKKLPRKSDAARAREEQSAKLLAATPSQHATKATKKKFEKARSVFASKEARKQRVRRLKRTNSAVKETLKAADVAEQVVPAFKDVFRRYSRSAGKTFWDGTGAGGDGAAPVSPSTKGPKLASAVEDKARQRAATEDNNDDGGGGPAAVGPFGKTINRKSKHKHRNKHHKLPPGAKAKMAGHPTHAHAEGGGSGGGGGGGGAAAGGGGRDGTGAGGEGQQPTLAAGAKGKAQVKRVADTNVVERAAVPPLITVFSAPNYRGEDQNLGGVLRVTDGAVLLQRFAETADGRSQNKPALSADEEDERRLEELIPYMPFTYEDLLQSCRQLEKQQRARQLLLADIERGTATRAHRRAASMTAVSGSAAASQLAAALAASTAGSKSVPTSPSSHASGGGGGDGGGGGGGDGPSVPAARRGSGGSDAIRKGLLLDAAAAAAAPAPAAVPKLAPLPSAASGATLEEQLGLPEGQAVAAAPPPPASNATKSPPSRRRAGFVPRYVGRRQSTDGRMTFSRVAGQVRCMQRAADGIKLHSSKSTPGRDRLSHIALSRGSTETASSIPLLGHLSSPRRFGNKGKSPGSSSASSSSSNNNNNNSASSGTSSSGSSSSRSGIGEGKSAAAPSAAAGPGPGPAESQPAPLSNADLLVQARRRSQGPGDLSKSAFEAVRRPRSPTMPGRATSMPTLRAVFGAAAKPKPLRRHTTASGDGGGHGEDAGREGEGGGGAEQASQGRGGGDTGDVTPACHVDSPRDEEEKEEDAALTPTEREESPCPGEHVPNDKLQERFASISDSVLDHAALKADMTFSKDELHVLKMCFLALDRDCNAQIDRVDIYGFGVDTPGDPCEEEVQEILKAMGAKEKKAAVASSSGGGERGGKEEEAGGLVVSIEEYFNFAIALKKNYVLEQAKQKFMTAQCTSSGSSSPRDDPDTAAVTAVDES